jgi:MoxR-like ATPase
MVYSQQREEFSTKFGPIFTQLLLADEINRSPAKVQSALLESMAEKQVTIGDNTHKLSSPFVVLATQNPIEQEGTYPLPEAQLDRFMMKVSVEYPDFAAEKSILDLDEKDKVEINSMLSTDDVLEIRDHVEKIHVDDKMKDLIVRIVRGTRPGDEHFSPDFEGIIQAGASPRAAIWLQKLGRFYAFLDNRDYVSPDDIMKVIPSVLGHRIILTYEANIDGVNGREISLRVARGLI